MYTHIYTHLQTYTLLQGSILTPIDTSLNEAPSNGYSSVELTPEQEAVLGATAESPFVLRPFGSPQTTTSSTPQNYVPGIPISITYKPRHYGNLSIPTPE
jgi:hypothetical protein